MVTDADLFGDGYSEIELATLRKDYSELADGRELEERARDLAAMVSMQKHAFRRASKDGKDAGKIAETIAALRRDYYAELTRSVGDGGAEPDDDTPIGVRIRELERSEPAELFGDKERFADFDGLGEYFDEYVRAPIERVISP